MLVTLKNNVIPSITARKKTRSLPKKAPITAAPSHDEIKTRFRAGWVKIPSQVHAPFVRSTGGLQSAAIEKSLLIMCWIL